MTTRLLFADLDGTVRLGIDQTGRWVDGPDDVELFPAAVRALRDWRADGGRVLGVTNQAGPVLGHTTYEAQKAIEDQTLRLADGLIDAVFTCLHAPDDGCPCRKPQPGLIHQGWAWARDRWGPTPAEHCLMVGDMDTDREAAAAAGLRFLHAEDWRGSAR